MEPSDALRQLAAKGRKILAEARAILSSKSRMDDRISIGLTALRYFTDLPAGRSATKSVALIPAFYGQGKAGFYAPTRFREIKRKVQRLVNADREGRRIEFHIKTFRDTYCQMLIDRDASKMSAVSVTMGHATTRTTEEHYGRMREVRALQEVNQARET